MNQHRDIERLLDHWLAEGSTVAPDRVADVVADRIERQSQRPAWLAERNPAMTPTLRIAAAVAAIAILGAGAIYLAGRTAPSNIGHPSSAPSATLAPSAPSSSPRTTTSRSFLPALRIDFPVGWIAASDDDRTFSLSATTTGTAPAGSLEIRRQPVVGSNANDCEGLQDATAGTSVSGIVDALSSDERFATAAAGAVSVDGRPAEAFDVRLSPTWTGTCAWSGGLPGAVLLTVADPPGGFVGLRGDEVIRVILLDVDGVVLSIVLSPADAADFDEFAAAAMPLVQSVVFTP